jgi:Peptidase family C25
MIFQLNKRLLALFTGILALSSSIEGQRIYNSFSLNTIEINWQAPVISQFTPTELRSFLSFDGASYDAERGFLPVYIETKPLGGNNANSARVELTNTVYQPIDAYSLSIIGASASYLQSEAELKSIVAPNRKVNYLQVTILPLRKNPNTGLIEKLVSFRLNVQPIFDNNLRQQISTSSFATSSVLSTGTWYRIGVTNTGIQKLDYNFLNGIGIDMATVDPRNIRVYGNRRGQLPYSNSGVHSDDLVECAIQVQGESDGIFDASDFVLFYGGSPNHWYYAAGANEWENADTTHKHFHHHVHNYSDTTYFFINTDLGVGKRIATQSSSSQTATHTVTSFDDFQFHESDNENLIKSGREWYGEKFDIIGSYSFGFNFPNIDASSPATVEVNLVSRLDGITHSYGVTAQSATGSITVPGTTGGCYYCPIANGGGTRMNFTPAGPVITVTVTRQNVAAVGWLNWIRVNARRELKMSGGMMSFRDSKSVGTGNVAAYSLDGYTSTLAVWDVSDMYDVRLQSVTPNAGRLDWTLAADQLHEFVAFDGSQFFSPTYFGTITNQNLHALQPVDFIIISHPDFLAQANELAQLHAQVDNLDYLIVTPQQIYNEFSAGAQDVTAIRDFLRMLYDRAPTQQDIPRYLLLFGDASYDNKRRLAGNSNFIPCFQNLNSVGYTESYVSDEYFGLLDDAGGWDGSSDIGFVDIGIGRFPVRTPDEAQLMVNKIRSYMTRPQPQTNLSACVNNQCSKGGEWRNWIAFIGDDEDSDIHMSQSDQLATIVDTAYDSYNIDKIYFDAYPQEQTPGGERYPDVVAAIDKRVDKGCLILNYTGHGGEVGLAHERVMEVTQINNWTNICNMPLFVTATCEFTRFDDPGRTSAGEYVFLNPNGGGVGLFTTVRLVYSTPNFNLNKKFYQCAFVQLNGEMPRVGDLYRITKVNSGNNTNNRNFTLIGDPALMLNYPVNQVKTTEINSVPVTSSSSDTLRALSHVTIKGFVADPSGNLMPNFNGILYPTVFDKTKTITTLANDPPNPAFTFNLQKSVLYHGKVSVVNGEFQFSFVVPKDISYQFGLGRISYYAEDGQTDATGYYEQIVIGGANTAAPIDVTGPDIRLFMNDSNFVSGGITNTSPSLYAIIADSNGVNTVGNGIGHDIVAVLDGETDHAIVLNDYYQANLNSYQRGVIIYPFANLTEGTHTLSLKVWDVYNNSNTTNITFEVTNPNGLRLDHVLNYPNPFTTSTSFFIEYNQCCTQYDVSIQVFTISGKLVKTINRHVVAEGYRSEAIEWDGKDDYGDRIGRGVYVYRVLARTEEGQSAEKYEKLVILN